MKEIGDANLKSTHPIFYAMLSFSIACRVDHGIENYVSSDEKY